ncbi:MAG: PQQ-dependent sugar dehydrogenase [Acidobacteria bacterium]|nr:PQQ-dependent sugar dehydrogenase [Acidobacteriota bacterium]
MNTSAFRSVLAAALLCLAAHVQAAVQLAPIVSGLSSPIFVGHAGDGSNRLFIVEQGGGIKVLQRDESVPTVFLDISAKTVASGERGLLGLAFHPDYSNNGRFFVFYTRAADGTLVIAEYRVSPDPNIAGPAEIVLLTIPDPLSNHNGGVIAFGPDGYLYIGPTIARVKSWHGTGLITAWIRRRTSRHSERTDGDLEHVLDPRDLRRQRNRKRYRRVPR